MRKLLVVMVVALLALGLLVPSAQALPALFEWATNVDGTVPGVPGGSEWNVAGFDTTTGLGTLTATVTGAGSHYVGVFLDLEFAEPTTTFFNEYGAAIGSPAAGQSWEIDEPGLVFGNIYDNFLASALDNSNGVPSSAPDDVSMALGWDFLLAAGETATISFITGITSPGGFVLQHTDPDTLENVYFRSNLSVSGGGGEPVPEPPMLLVLGSFLAGLVGFRGLRRRG